MTDQATQIANGAGFIAALDQSGGSTPKALGLYGVDASTYDSEEDMFAEVQKMRERIIVSPDFNNKKVIGAILFERTMNEEINGKPVAHYLWEDTGVVPFLKIDKGLVDEANGVQLMKPMPGLMETLTKAKAAGIFGTKERSVVKSANAAGIKLVVEQQFEVASQVIAAGLMPIVEPEVDIHAVDKAQAEDMKDVLTLITELAVFENEPNAVNISVETLITHGTGPNPLFTCFVAEYNDKIVGMALVYYRFSTWDGKSLHLEDLIVSEKYRGKGYGKALYNEVMRYAESQDINRVEWVVLDWNTNAIDFYESSGALLLKDWYLVQMNKERLKKYIDSIS